MPESLFAPRRFRRRYLAYCALTAITLEGSVVGIAQVWPQIKTAPVPIGVTQIDSFPFGSEPTVPPVEVPQPTPDEPTPPPEPEPTPDSEGTPPPADEPEMMLDTPKPAPTSSPVKRSKLVPSTISHPTGVSRGNHPPIGLPGGTSNAPQIPGALPIKTGGTWRVGSKPPYPAQARASHITGNGTIRLVTDALGKITGAAIGQSTGNAILDGAIISHAKLNWSGPPNATTTVSFTFRLP